MSRRRPHRNPDEQGFALLLVFVLAAGIAIGLLMQLPRVAFETQRNREEMLIERGEQYQRAIGLYLKTVKRYPAKIEDLENTNNIRFLRRRYIDPMTGKDDWRLVHVGPTGQLTDSLVQKAPVKTTKDGKPDGKADDPMNVDPSNTVGVEQGPVEVNAAVKARPSDMVGGVPVGAPPPPGQPGVGPDGQPDPSAVQPGYPQPGQPGYQGGQPGQPGYPVGAQTPYLQRRMAMGAQPGVPQGQTGQAAYPPGYAQPGQPVQPGQVNYPPGYPQPGQPVQPGQVNYPPGYPQPGQPVQPGQVNYPPGYPQPGQPLQPGQVNYPPGYPQPGQPVQPGQVNYPPGYPQPGQPVQPGQQPYNPMQGMPGMMSQQGQANAPGMPVYTQQGNPNQPGLPAGAASGSGNQQQPVSAQQLIQGILTGGRTATPSAFNNQSSYGGGIAGVATKYKGPSIKIYNDRQKYQEWEFVYDPKKDKALMQGMPAANAPNAGGLSNSSSSGSSSFGSSSSGNTSSFGSGSSSSGFGSSNSSSFGSGNSSSGFGSGPTSSPTPSRTR